MHHVTHYYRYTIAPEFSNSEETVCDVAVITGGIRNYVVVSERDDNCGSMITEVFGEIAVSLLDNGIVEDKRLVWIESLPMTPRLLREVIFSHGISLGYVELSSPVKALINECLDEVQTQSCTLE